MLPDHRPPYPPRFVSRRRYIRTRTCSITIHFSLTTIPRARTIIMLKLPCLLVFIVGVSTATAADSEPAAVEDPLISMYRKQETLLANMQREMLLKFNEVAAKFSEMSTKLESLDRKYGSEVASITDSLTKIKSRLRLNCPTGFLGNVHGCYKFTTTYMTYEDADAECKQAGGHLWEIDSTSEANDVADIMKKNNVRETYYYTGGLRHSNGKWVWERTGAPMTYTKWWPGHPSSDASYDRVMFYYYPSSSTFHMTVYDQRPSGTHYSICEV